MQLSFSLAFIRAHAPLHSLLFPEGSRSFSLLVPPQEQVPRSSTESKGGLWYTCGYCKVCNISPAQNPPVFCFHIQNKGHTLPAIYEIPWNLNPLQIPSLSLSFSFFVYIEHNVLRAVPSSHTKFSSTPGPLHFLPFAQIMHSLALSLIY